MKIELTEEEWNRALNAMALASYVQIAPLMAKMFSQLQEQQNEVKKEPEKPRVVSK